MIKGYVDIAKKWAFVFAYDIDEDDLSEIAEWMDSLGASREQQKDATTTIMQGNSAFTYSNTRKRMSVVCIGWATTEEQWWDSVTHELDHLQNIIMRYYDVECGSEEAAYLQGYLMRGIISVIRKGES